MKSEWWTTLRNPTRQFHYSTGLQGVVMALGLSESVRIYGFGKAARLKHHYFSQHHEELKEVHDYNAEYEFYSDLEQRNIDEMPFFKAASITQLPSFRIMAWSVESAQFWKVSDIKCGLRISRKSSAPPISATMTKATPSRARSRQWHRPRKDPGNQSDKEIRVFHFNLGKEQ